MSAKPSFALKVAPSQGRELKHEVKRNMGVLTNVAPSQGRELKLGESLLPVIQSYGRPFTGA